jgi:hypothetical protein
MLFVYQKHYHLMPSQWSILDLQAFEIETVDDSRIRPKSAHELASCQVGGSFNLSYIPHDHKNYLCTKRQREMKYCQTGNMLS